MKFNFLFKTFIIGLSILFFASCDKDFNETWENYLVGAGYFAANVPHGIVINSDGLIPVECLKWV